jgi:uncharacterized protein
MKQLLICLSLIGMVLLLGACPKKSPDSSSPKTSPTFRKDGELQIHSADGDLKASFEIEIVQKDIEVMQGLKYRDAMAEDQAMLFIFEHIDYHSFWMQDTYLSLDMIFIDQNNRIIYIEKDTTPFSEEQILPDQPNKYVLEVLAGTTDKFEIIETDVVSWQILEN